jgi:ABC-type transport system involved in multi-copper enzyme maturation permease subunit
MIRLTWLQLRVQVTVVLAALAAFAVILMVTGPHLAGLYAASAIASCHGGACANAANTFLSGLTTTSPYPTVYELGIGLILAAPAIVGIFWGAPLIARELENRTFVLAWTQSVTRTRWLVVKLALTGLAAIAVTEALSLMQAWWADPISKAIGLGGPYPVGSVFGQGRLGSFIFPTSGITPLGYAAFGFALGTATGALVRRTVPAMAVTLAIIAAVQVAMPLWVRPHLIPPDRTVVSGPSFFESAGLSVGTLKATTVPGQPEAWILSSGAINAAGQPVSRIPVPCLGPPSVKGPSPNAGACMASRGIRETITYQPASRYWPFQWIETGIFLALALALAGFCFWRLGRRRPDLPGESQSVVTAST